MPPRIVIAAGGTGGHIYPGLALAAALRRACPDGVVTFAGTERGMEGRLVVDAGYELDLYRMAPFNGQGWRKALVPGVLAVGSLQAWRVLRRRQASVAVTMGGYSGVPLVVGARLAGVPTLVHEPGAVPGQANRLAARFTGNIATSFPETAFPGRTVRYVGYPLQAELANIDRAALREQARASYGLADGVTMILVNGGSQGALRLNQLALGLAERWADRTDIRLVVKAGSRTYDEIAAALADCRGREMVRLVRYLDRMDLAYAAADLAICRAGAATVAELAIAGLPSVLVPLPQHEHDEQAHNAAPLVAAGGALLVRDHEATAAVVGPLIERLVDGPPIAEQPAAAVSLLDAMAAGATSVARPDGAAELAAWVLELAGVAA
jgi:UDP-N-acetylglucosamine--N-acetylmuramyl-(pentapeptide) pyrophosphoryl-undecaprenol N-acetylglucosamine transferase